MNCKVCGADVPAGNRFCRVCGTAVEASQAAAPAPAPIQQTSLRCAVCGNSITPGAKFCNVCGNPSVPTAPAAPADYSAPSYTAPSYTAPTATSAAASAPKGTAGNEKLNQVLSFVKNPKNLMPLLIGVGAIALILVVVILISSLSGGPVTSVAKAIDKTVIGGNFTAEFDVEIAGEKLSGTAMVNMNVKKHQITALVELKAGGEKMVMGIYEEEMFMYYPSEKYGYTQDIGSELDDIFEAYEENKKLDMEKLAELYEDMTGEDLEDYVDLKAAEKGAKKLVKKLNSKSWLEENAGYETQKKSGSTIHVFEPDLYDLVMAAVVFFEDAIEDYDDMIDVLEEGEDFLSDLDVTLEIGVKSNKLTSIEAELMNMIEVSAEFSDIGKTKIDVEELEDYIDDCE